VLFTVFGTWSALPEPPLIGNRERQTVDVISSRLSRFNAS
jgi:hypothetical protein